MPILCKCTAFELNHSAGGNWAENVSICLCFDRPLRRNKRESNEAFSVRKKQIGSSIRLDQVGKSTHLATTNLYFDILNCCCLCSSAMFERSSSTSFVSMHIAVDALRNQIIANCDAVQGFVVLGTMHCAFLMFEHT